MITKIVKWAAYIIYPPSLTKSQQPTHKQPEATTMFLIGRNVPEILTLINNAPPDDRITFIRRYQEDTALLVLMDLWCNGEFEDFSNVEYFISALPNGLAPQTLTNNLARLNMLQRGSAAPKYVQDKILSNILSSINQDEIELLLAILNDNVEELYPNISKELIMTNLSVRANNAGS